MDIAVYILVGLVSLVVLNVAFGLLIAKLHVAQLRRQTAGSVVLTYDDGPSKRLEPRLLELLDRHDAKATFFVVGKRVHDLEDRCAALAANGHEVASHGESHVNAWKAMPWQVLHDIRDGFRTIRAYTSADTPFRPPHGKLTLWSYLLLRLRGAPLAKWTVDSNDTMPVATRGSVQRVVDLVRADGGGVVLLHSFDRTSDTEKEDYVMSVTEALLESAKSSGLAVRTYSEMLRARFPGAQHRR